MPLETENALHGLWMSLAVLAASLEEMRRGVQALENQGPPDWLAAYT